ncbi:hypothetical protein VMCG_05669 [Cytospora schulzeri]|uniref:Uncharacterized protein n=1 Tax=Cytospora schulzeri TaxID=448051 RepID=A0A423WF19_9PEZI|nr:hypothetical protein VMCG_05669 [Valsa malicola]
MALASKSGTSPTRPSSSRLVSTFCATDSQVVPPMICANMSTTTPVGTSSATRTVWGCRVGLLDVGAAAEVFQDGWKEQCRNQKSDKTKRR